MINAWYSKTTLKTNKYIHFLFQNEMGGGYEFERGFRRLQVNCIKFELFDHDVDILQDRKR